LRPQMKKRISATLLKMPKRRVMPAFGVESRILFLRSPRVILDADIAKLYGVPVKRLNQQVKRNQERFPSDFMFQLTDKEHDGLRSQIATSEKGRGGRRYAPFAFTEHGAIMAATVLNSGRAVQMSVFVVARLRAIARDAGNEPQACWQDRRTGESFGYTRFRNPGSHRSDQGTHDASRSAAEEHWIPDPGRQG